MNYTFSLVQYEYFLLCLVRVATFVFVAPFFNLTTTPNRVKIGFSFFVSVIVITTIQPEEAVTYNTVIGYGVLVLKEALAGLLMGFALNMCTYIINFAGFVIDMDIGISMAQEFNPVMNTQSTITGMLYFYGVNALLIVSGMYQYIIRAVIDSFTLFPLGGEVYKTDSLLSTMVVYMSDFFTIAFRIMLPIFACIMIMNVVLGIMAKVAPQMNMFSVGIQLKIMMGFTVLYLTAFLIPNIADFIFKEMRTILVSFLGGMY